MDLHESLFERIISRPRNPWITLGVGLLLSLAPVAFVIASGDLNDLSQGRWRGLLVPPTVILYILVVTPKMARMGIRVLDSIRPQVLIDDENFSQIIRETSYIKPRHELVAFGVGALVGLLLAVSGTEATFSWFTVSWLLLTCLADGLVAWAIYTTLAGTRVINTLLRQPLRIDPFDVSPFEPIGRESLLLALVFAGGIALSLVFVALEPRSFRLLVFWLTYIPLLFVTVAVFFLNMYPTHKVLVAARARELAGVQRLIQEACRKLARQLEENQDTGRLAVEINALVVYEGRLQAARTWPYNTPMLRALFFSVLIPVGATLARLALEIFL